MMILTQNLHHRRRHVGSENRADEAMITIAAKLIVSWKARNADLQVKAERPYDGRRDR